MTSRTVRSMMVGTAMFPENVLHAEAKVENQELRNHMMENELEKIKQEKVGLDQSQTARRKAERKSASRSEHESASQSHWETADEYGQNLIQRPNKFDKPPKKQDKNPNNSIAGSSKNCCGEDSKQNDCCARKDTEHSSTNSEKTKSARSVGLRGSDDTKGKWDVSFLWFIISSVHLILGTVFLVLYSHGETNKAPPPGYDRLGCFGLDYVSLGFQWFSVIDFDYNYLVRKLKRPTEGNSSQLTFKFWAWWTHIVSFFCISFHGDGSCVLWHTTANEGRNFLAWIVQVVTTMLTVLNLPKWTQPPDPGAFLQKLGLSKVKSTLMTQWRLVKPIADR